MGRVVAVIVVVLLFALAPLARAQHSGGHMGGGSFSSHSSGGGGGGGGGGYSHHGGGYHSGGGSGNLGGGGAVVMLLVFGVICVVGMALKGGGDSWNRRGYGSSGDDLGGPERADVTVVRVALDARVRPFVQKRLDDAASNADTSTQPGLADMLTDVVSLMRSVRSAWLFVGGKNHAMMSLAEAESAFNVDVANARATFTDETVIAEDGKVLRSAARPSGHTTEEGDGLVLVSIVVAARQELVTLSDRPNADEVRRALEVLSGLTGDTLVAVQIVWTPSDPDDRMSSVELQALGFDDLTLVPGALAGKVICAYCSGPFPKELRTCPHCGAELEVVEELPGRAA